MNSKEAKIIKHYAKLTKKLKRQPTWDELVRSTNISRSTIKEYSNTRNLEVIKAEAKEEYPECFTNTIDEDVFNATRFKELKSTIAKHQKFLITTVKKDDKIFYDGFKALKNYAEKNKALPLFLIADNDLSGIDSLLLNEQIVFDTIHLNKNLTISPIKIKSEAVDPVAGLPRIGNRENSYILASPKQRLKAVPTEHDHLPHLLMTTGAITEPNYIKNTYIQKKRDFLADLDHVMGGLIVEILDDTFFLVRQFQFDNQGSFIDLGVEYDSKGSSRIVALEAMVPGDWHMGHTDQVAREAVIQMINHLKPKRLFFHDFFDGTSVSHHTRDKKIFSMTNILSLEEELTMGAKELNLFSSLVPNVYLVKSNHDEFLDRYLDSGYFMDDKMNGKTAVRLAVAKLDGKDPLEVGYRTHGLTAKNVNFYQRDQSLKIKGIEHTANHGDKGSNGARGSVAAMEMAYGLIWSGHAHSPEILRGAWQVPALEVLRPGYNIGGSSWAHGCGLTYYNGSRQLIIFINGQYKK